jgi:hypothetical protein
MALAAWAVAFELEALISEKKLMDYFLLLTLKVGLN